MCIFKFERYFQFALQKGCTIFTVTKNIQEYLVLSGVAKLWDRQREGQEIIFPYELHSISLLKT